ncbi:TIGR03557 family F420-dependent LLM class oxidoreductase [Amycolatopsis suaedae]|uniref:TIGR03557 family F420-dependent LLM class oxidoreductase n=1 Tax=Amycolatopsis suaedae TaxID=2510978 RepID=A0A4Q7J113_9PSEU|nr:TIGR03557 family F420-dependent LLM class oxidoreductase [Amycolatopsis suaedae]RZQ60272.1 TIGR03557 family F420-dependent LLM class oxidoreductase [Amycolatopsis suaedae]
MRFGYTLMTEQAGPRELVGFAGAAERAGFDFEVMSDHYFPWLEEQGHSPYAWSVLGAVTQSTERVELMTYVTCPIIRYHPAVVAQKAATVQLLSQGRFTLGLGAGENLNEHVTGGGWPPANVRHEMLAEAVHIISDLFDGGHVNFTGDHYRVDSAKLWDLPPVRPAIGVAVSGEQSVARFAPAADVLIAVQPEAGLCRSWDRHRRDAGMSEPGRKVGQLPICWDPDRDAAIKRAHAQFRWFGGGWKVNAELPGPAAFAAATQYVTPEDVAEAIPCGPDTDAIVEAFRPFADAGFTDVALVQIGGDTQDSFLDHARDTVLPALREAYPG